MTKSYGKYKNRQYKKNNKSKMVEMEKMEKMNRRNSSTTCSSSDNDAILTPNTCSTPSSPSSPNLKTARALQKLHEWKLEFRATYLAFTHWHKITKDQINASILQRKMKECGNWKESLDLIETGLWWAPMLDHQHKDAMLVVLKHLENNVKNLDSQIIVQEHQLQNMKLELHKINAINHAQAILLERKSIKIRELYAMTSHH
jgi:hypothetical protein